MAVDDAGEEGPRFATGKISKSIAWMRLADEKGGRNADRGRLDRSGMRFREVNGRTNGQHIFQRVRNPGRIP